MLNCKCSLNISVSYHLFVPYHILIHHLHYTNIFKKAQKPIVGEDQHIVLFFIPYYCILHFRRKLVGATNCSRAWRKMASSVLIGQAQRLLAQHPAGHKTQELASYCVLSEPRSLQCLLEQHGVRTGEKTLTWLQICVSKWERVLGSFENRSASSHLVTLNISLPDYSHFPQCGLQHYFSMVIAHRS